MLKTKLATLALAGVLTIGSSFTAFAAETETPSTPNRPAIQLSQEEKAAVLAEKGEAFAQSMETREAKLLEAGKTEEEIAALKERAQAKFDELKLEKAAGIAEKKAQHEAAQAQRAENGVQKGNRQASAL